MGHLRSQSSLGLARLLLVLGVFFLFSGSALSQVRSLLLLPPFLGRPTHTSIAINIVAGQENIVCFARFKKEKGTDSGDWQKTPVVSAEANQAVTLELRPLEPDALYGYELYGQGAGQDRFERLAAGAFRTQRSKPEPFSFALLSDPHIDPYNRDRFEQLQRISDSIHARRPEFLAMLGDNIQTFASHGGPLEKEEHGPFLYRLLRRSLGELPANTPVFAVIGNWEGENGWHPEEKRRWARSARQAHIPNPDEKTYPEGGSREQDYYGFTWGNTLCLFLNVLSYTPNDHHLTTGTGRADDWTLGEAQKAWLYRQLSQSKAKWKFLFIHHTVGGKAGDDRNSRYGRGGGRAAKVGEQALLHDWMKKFGVQALFYGHDHVFTDMTVDGIHYTCVGSAGAPWKFGRSETGYEKWWEPSGYAWVEVGETATKVSFVRPDPAVTHGVAMHSFSIPLK